MYHNKKRGNKKEYINILKCSLARSIHFELLPDQITNVFIRALKRLITKKERPEKIYSYHAKTHLADSKWVKKIVK